MSDNQNDPQHRDESASPSEDASAQDDSTLLSEEIRAVKLDPQNPEETTSSPEAGGSCPDVPNPVSSVTDSNAPIEGPSESEILESRSTFTYDEATAEELNKRASLMGKYNMNAGKLDVFQRYFHSDKMHFNTSSDNAPRQHPAGSRRHISEARIPESGERNSSNEDPFKTLRFVEPPPEPILNQAGGVVGYKRRDTDLQSQHNEAEAEHSIGSAETALIGEIFSENYPRESPIPSSRGVSPGASRPSLQSCAETSSSSDGEKTKIYSLSSRDSPDDDRAPAVPNIQYPGGDRNSPSTDSEVLTPAKMIRRRRPATRRQVNVPKSGDSAHAGSEGSSPSDEPKAKVNRICEECAGGASKHASAHAKELVPEERAELRPVTESDDDAAYPELLHSVTSEECVPRPDLREEDLEEFDEADGSPAGASMDRMSNINENRPMSISPDEASNSNDAQPMSTSSDTEEEPVTVLSVSPEPHPPKDDNVSNKDCN